MFINLKDALKGAKEDKRALGSFNVYSYETIRGVIKAAKEAQSPAIVSFGASYLKNMSLETVYSIALEAASETEGQIVLHLDHCTDINIIKRAVGAGFTSVMYDGSALDFEENVKNTSEVVKLAHAKNVSVEAELGSIALGEFSNETEIDHGQSYTDPIKAKEFAERTGIDALAVSIGTVHGMYKAKPGIRVDILKKINDLTSVPLVLHGGSGTPEEKILECIENGICKINVNTEISQYTVMKIRELLNKSENTHLSKLSLEEISFVSEVVFKYIKLFLNK